MKLYNSLSRQVEEFEPLKKGKVGMYACGVTVYDYAHIGHGRKYVNDDILRRVLAYKGYSVSHVQNVTDVGHLVSDADEGEDKLEKGAQKAGKTVWETAEMFIENFFESMDRLNILRPGVLCRATDHIPEMIELIGRLENKGFAYDTPEAVYFEVGKFPRYGELAGQRPEDKLVAVREEVKSGDHKRNPADFALWFKLVGRFERHVMRWPSPWGEGFPGWHIECSAMSMKYLGESFDIHTGGEDHIPVHHTNEIAQSEAATGKPFVKYWFHTVFLQVEGQKMSKSLGNFLTLTEVEAKGFSPMALRYLYLTAHYRKPLNFTWSSLAAAQTAYEKLVQFVEQAKLLERRGNRQELSKEKLKKLDGLRDRFEEAIENDLNMPQAVAVVWELLKSNIPDYDKLDQLLSWDQVLGLRLGEAASLEGEVPEKVKQYGVVRQTLRDQGKYVEADQVRVEIEKLGWEVRDTSTGPVYKRRINA